MARLRELVRCPLSRSLFPDLLPLTPHFLQLLLLFYVKFELV